MIYYIVLAGIIVYSIIAGNMMMTVIATALVVLPFSYAASKGLTVGKSRKNQLITMGVLAVVALMGLPMHAFPITITASLVIVCYALGYSGAVRDFLHFKMTSIRRQVDRHPLLRRDWMKRAPMDASMFDMKDLHDMGTYYMPKDTTHGIPGSGIANVSEFGSRAKAGAEGEIVLAGMLVRSGLLSITGVHSFWSMKTPNAAVDIDVDCAILYGDNLWLLDAKRYLPDHDQEYLVRDISGSEYSYNGVDSAKYHPVLRMVKLDGEQLRSLHADDGHWTKPRFDAMVERVNAIMRNAKEYDQTSSGNISYDTIAPLVRSLHGTMDVHAITVLTPTKMGIPGVGVDTDYAGGIPLDQAPAVIDSIMAYIRSNPTNVVRRDVIARLDTLVKDNA